MKIARLVERLRLTGSGRDVEERDIEGAFESAKDELETNVSAVERACVVNEQPMVTHGAWLRRMYELLVRASRAVEQHDDDARRMRREDGGRAAAPAAHRARDEGGEATDAPDASARRIVDLELASVDRLIEAADAESGDPRSQATPARGRAADAAQRERDDAARRRGVRRKARAPRAADRANRPTRGGWTVARGGAHPSAPSGADARRARSRVRRAVCDADHRGRTRRREAPVALVACAELARRKRVPRSRGVARAERQSDVRRRPPDDREGDVRQARKTHHSWRNNRTTRSSARPRCTPSNISPTRARAGHRRGDLRGRVLRRRRRDDPDAHRRARDDHARGAPPDERPRAPARDRQSRTYKTPSSRIRARSSSISRRAACSRGVSSRTKTVTRPKTVLRGEVRAYVLDGSGSMIGPRARMRDAILSSEILTLRRRMMQHAKLAHVVLFYRYFAEKVEPRVRVDTVAQARRVARRRARDDPHGRHEHRERARRDADGRRGGEASDPDLARAQVVIVTDGQAPSTRRRSRRRARRSATCRSGSA